MPINARALPLFMRRACRKMILSLIGGSLSVTRMENVLLQAVMIAGDFSGCQARDARRSGLLAPLPRTAGLRQGPRDPSGHVAELTPLTLRAIYRASHKRTQRSAT